MHALAAAAVLLVVQSAVVSRGDPVTVRVAGTPPAAPTRVYLSNRAGRVVPVGTIPSGRRRLVFRLPGLAADVYAPTTRAGARVIVGRGRLSMRALAPAGFGPLSASGCTPSSPVSGRDAFGTAAGAQLWALPFPPAGASVAAGTFAFDGVVGQTVKIVFKLTSGIPSVFYAVTPDGRTVPPAWGPEPHLGSSWNRPGAEWGAGFTFDLPGCWRIHAGAPPAQGDLWLVVRS